MQTIIVAIIFNYFGANDTLACVSSVRANAPGNVFYLVDDSADASERIKVESIFKDSSDVKILFPPEYLGFTSVDNLAHREVVSDQSIKNLGFVQK